MVLCTRIVYAYSMFQKLYSSKSWRLVSRFGLVISVAAGLQSCAAFLPSTPAGLIVGPVINANGRPSLQPADRWRYADQLASSILDANPELSGNLDSYEYLARRVGAPLEPLLKAYRKQGDLNSKALESLQSAELRRRYLMMVSILPEEQSFPLKPDIQPVIGKLNREVRDYRDQHKQTILLAGVRVQVFDTFAGRKISDSIVRSDDGGRILANESKSRQYVGNSVFATVTNALSNALNAEDGKYPPPPNREDVLRHIWTRVAVQLPRAVY